MISIIIPSFNRLQVLKRCVQSIIPQFYSGLEIVIIDDASNDGTRAYLTELSANYNYFKIIVNKENRGVNYSRNRGIEIVSNPYLMFIDSDDQVIAGSLRNILNIINNASGRSHYLFLLSYRNPEFQDWKNPKEIFYKDWMKGTFSGDFTHVVSTEIFRKYMFFEQFRMFEQLNWFRIYKATSPQLLIPIAVADIELGRTDSLSVSQKLKSLPEVEAKFSSEFFFYELFYPDLKQYNPSYLRLPLIKNIFLGVACNKIKDCEYLISIADKFYVKLTGHFFLLLPSKIALFLITWFSNTKRKLFIKTSN